MSKYEQTHYCFVFSTLSLQRSLLLLLLCLFLHHINNKSCMLEESSPSLTLVVDVTQSTHAPVLWVCLNTHASPCPLRPVVTWLLVQPVHPWSSAGILSPTFYAGIRHLWRERGKEAERHKRWAKIITFRTDWWDKQTLSFIQWHGSQNQNDITETNSSWKWTSINKY